MKKIVLVALVLMGVNGFADGYTTKIGNSYFHSDGTSTTQIGKSAFHSDGTSSNTIGNSTFNSDGSSSTRVGNSNFNSDGSYSNDNQYQKSGNTVYGGKTYGW